MFVHRDTYNILFHSVILNQPYSAMMVNLFILSIFFLSLCRSQQLGDVPFQIVTSAGKIYLVPAFQATTFTISSTTSTPVETSVPDNSVSNPDNRITALRCPDWDMLLWVSLTSDQRNIPSKLEPGTRSPSRIEGNPMIFLIWCNVNIPIRRGVNELERQFKDLVITDKPKTLEQCIEGCVLYNQGYSEYRCIAISLDKNSICYLKGHDFGGTSLISKDGAEPLPKDITRDGLVSAVLLSAKYTANETWTRGEYIG